MADMAKLDEAIERLEGMFGGYVGEGDLVDEVNWVIDQLSNERTNTLNKINEVTQTFNDLRDKMKGAAALDPKGNIVLEQFDSTALVVRTGSDGKVLPKQLEPYVVASRYDPRTGEWAAGSYYSDLGNAYEYANPEIFEDGSIQWTRDDIAEALEEAGITATDITVTDLLAEVSCMRGWRDVAISHGKEMLQEYAQDYAKELKAEDKALEKEAKGVSLADRANAAKEVSSGMEQGLPQREFNVEER